MGYSITIGQLLIEKEPDEVSECSGLRFTAEGVTLDNAPAFGEPTDHTNSRWPSYSAWADCLRDAGMFDLFFQNRELIGGHPGVRLITEEFYSDFKGRMDAFKKKHPNVKATYGDTKSVFETDPENPKENGTYCRIVWLDFWLRWSLDNCETPVIANH